MPSHRPAVKPDQARPRSSELAPSGWRGPLCVLQLAVLHVGLFLTLFVLSVSAVTFAPAGSSTAVWWPAAGVGVAAACLSRGRLRWLTLFVIAVGGGAGNLVGGRSAALTLVFVAANVGEAALVAHLLARRRRPELTTLGDLGRLYVFVSLGAAVAGLLAASGVWSLSGGAFWQTWLTVLCSHGAASLLGAALVASTVDALPRLPRWELTLQWLAVLGVTLLVFSPDQRQALAFLPLPALAWPALRRGVRVATLQLLGVGVLATTLTAQGFGPFAITQAGSAGITGALVQLFLVVGTLVTLALAVTGAQGRTALVRLRDSERRLVDQRRFDEAVLESVPAGVLACDDQGVVVLRNAAQRGMAGSTGPEPGARAAPSVFLRTEAADPKPDVAEPLRYSPLHRALAGELCEDLALHVSTSDGRDRALKMTTRQIRSEQGRLLGAVAATSDVTEELIAQHELLRSVASLEIREHELEKNNADLAAVATATTAVLTGQDARAAICQAAQEISGALAALLFEPDGAGSLCATRTAGLTLPPISLPVEGASLTAEAFRSGRVDHVADVRTHRRTAQGIVQLIDECSGGTDLQATLVLPVHIEGKVKAVLVLALREPVPPADLRRRGLFDLLRTNAALALAREGMVDQLAEQASTDPLTGVANRREWGDQLDLAAHRALRDGEPFTVCILDLDHFKRFNDSFGHPEGDRLLQELTRRWQTQLRAGDVLARLGGEEFGIVFQRCGLPRARDLADRFLAVVPNGQTCSAGLAQQQPGESADALFSRADAALYRAKATGRDRACADESAPLAAMQ